MIAGEGAKGTGKLRIACCQLGPYPGDEAAVKEQLLALFEKAAATRPDVVCFPELMHVPYFCSVLDDRYFGYAESLRGPTVSRFVRLARDSGIWIIATLFERTRGKYFNSAVLISPTDGLRGVYRKVHLPKMDASSAFLDEPYYFSAGARFAVFDVRGVPVGMLICFDKSFPESFRVLMLKGARVVFVPSNYSGALGNTFVRELRTRALENGLFVAAVNKAGDEGLPGIPGTHHFFGRSCIIGPSGKIIAELGDEADAVAAGEIDLDEPGGPPNVMDWRKFRRPGLYSLIARTTKG